MAAKFRWPHVLAFLLVAGSMVGNTRAGGNIAVYWGQNGNEGTLADACKSGNYAYVMLAFLSIFSNNKPSQLDLSGHCNPGDCAGQSSDIKACQTQGIKVLLSLGGEDHGRYGLSSGDEANNLANYLWDNFLGGTGSSSRPLGEAVLDGIDFDIETGKPAHYDELARALREKGALLLTAAPQCRFPDASLTPALQAVQFDVVWVQFYNNEECQYSNGGDDGRLVSAWKMWTSSVNAKAFYLGLPASADGAMSGGYIPPGDFTGKVIPDISGVGKYGGIMLWNRFFDVQKRYSDQVKGRI